MKKEIHILILEDVAADAVLINHELRKAGLTFRSKRVEKRETYLYELEHHPPDLILSDHGLPDFDGFTALAIARDKRPDVPFIFVTGSVGEEVVVETLKSGATDYVLKSRLATNLAPAVRHALREAEERKKRRQAEMELRESEERFRMLVQGIKDYAIFMLDPTGRVTCWGAGAEWIQGYASDEIIGQHFSRFYPAEEVAHNKPNETLTIAAGESRFEEEGWRMRKGQSRFWAHTVITALRSKTGELRGFVVVTRDMTDRKRVQEALQQSEDRYRQSVGLYPDGLFVIGAKDQIAFANPAAARLLGAVDAEHLVGKSLKEIFPPKQWEGLEERIRTKRGHEPITPFTEGTLVRPDGTPVEVRVSAAPLPWSGEPCHQIIVQDISDYKRSVEAIRESEARKAAILETALDAIITIDQNGNLQEWNPAAERIFGFRRDEALGRSMDELIIPPSLREVYREGLADYLMTGVGSLLGRPIQLTVMRSNGAKFTAELALTRVPKKEPPIYTGFIRDISERIESEKALRNSEEQFRALIEYSWDAIALIDARGDILYASPSTSRVLGYTTEELVGRNAMGSMHPDDVEQHKGAFSQLLLAPGTTMTAQFRYRHKEGSWRWLEGTATNLLTEPSVYAIVANCRDITERKQTEGALRRSEERFRMLVEGVTDYAIYMLDPTGRVVSWNAGAERIEGYHAEEIIGKSQSCFYPPEQVERNWPSEILRMAAAEGRFREESWRVRKDGSTYWANVVITALREDAGEIFGFSSIVRDMTERKRADEALSRLATIVESSQDAILRKTLDGIITDWNPAAETLYGYSAAEAIGRHVSVLVPPDRKEEEEQILEPLRRGQGIAAYETVRLRKDGQPVVVSVAISPIKDAQGRVIGASTIARDMTERKRIEDEVRKLNTELESRVAERTMELEAANRELEAFSYSVSHDLRAPLRHIHGFAEILQKEAASKLDATSQGYLKTLCDSAKRLGTLIDDLLEFSRMSRTEIRTSQVNLVELAEMVRQDLRHDAEGRDIEWVIGDLPEVQGDPTLLRQVLVNLISNALKYTRPRPRARIELGWSGAAKETVIFIRDNGVGFDMAYVDKLFGVFQRLHRPAEFEGTGIGLANVHRIIQRHGGRTWAEGEVGAGATFYFSLPNLPRNGPSKS